MLVTRFRGDEVLTAYDTDNGKAERSRELPTAKEARDYLRGRFRSQCKCKTESPAFRSQAAKSLT